MIYSCGVKEEQNPFLADFQTENGVPPFDEIKMEHYEPAFLKGIEEQNKNIEEINSKSLIRIVEVLQVEDNLPTEGSNEISRNSFGRRIKVRLYEDSKNLKENELPWVWPLLPKHLQVIPKVGEMVLVFFQNLDGAQGNRFYIGPIISQDYYLDKGGTKEALSLLQAKESTKPLCPLKGMEKMMGHILMAMLLPYKDVVTLQCGLKRKKRELCVVISQIGGHVPT